jgi:hypothetical protein
VATIQDILNQINASRPDLSKLSTALDTSALVRSPAMLAFAKQRDILAKMVQSQSATMVKLVGDYQKSLSIPTSTLAKLSENAEAVRRIGESIGPSPSFLRAIQKSQLQVAKALELIGKNAALLENRQLGFHAARLVPSLPNVRWLAAIQQRDLQGHAVLDDAGYEIVYQLIGGSFAAEFASVSPQVRGAAVTNRLLAFTKSTEFEEGLLETCGATPILQRRWPILRQALEAHRRREYWIAVPVLMSQLEGLISDALVLRSFVRRSKGKFYELDAQGQLKLNRRGTPVELIGLASKVQRFSLAGFGDLQGVVDLLNSELRSRRNGVLHGSDLRYGTAKLSIQLLLSVYLWALEIAAFVG